MFGDGHVHVGARDGDGVLREPRDDAAYGAATGGGEEGSDAGAAGGGAGAAQEIGQSAGAGDLASTDEFGIGLSKQVDFQNGIDRGEPAQRSEALGNGVG